MRHVAAVLAVGLLLSLGACTGGGDGDAAPTGTATLAAGCDGVLTRLPTSLMDQEQASRSTPGAAPQGPNGGAVLASFGDPAIRVSCGLADTGPTTDPCLSVNDVDWVNVGADPNADPQAEPDPDAPDLRFTTYGRTPVVEVTVPASYGAQNASTALVDLTSAVEPLPVTGACIGDDDS